MTMFVVWIFGILFCWLMTHWAGKIGINDVDFSDIFATFIPVVNLIFGLIELIAICLYYYRKRHGRDKTLAHWFFLIK